MIQIALYFLLVGFLASAVACWSCRRRISLGAQASLVRTELLSIFPSMVATHTAVSLLIIADSTLRDAVWPIASIVFCVSALVGLPAVHGATKFYEFVGNRPDSDSEQLTVVKRGWLWRHAFWQQQQDNAVATGLIWFLACLTFVFASREHRYAVGGFFFVLGCIPAMGMLGFGTAAVLQSCAPMKRLHQRTQPAD